MTDIEDVVAAKIIEWAAMTQVMAEQCRTTEVIDGLPVTVFHCYVCGATDSLHCVAPGWGGVWVCNSCEVD